MLISFPNLNTKWFPNLTDGDSLETPVVYVGKSQIFLPFFQTDWAPHLEFGEAPLIGGPTNLSAVTRSDRTTVLTWVDNAVNETGFIIYFQQGGSGFNPLFTDSDLDVPNLETYTTAVLDFSIIDFYIVAYNADGHSVSSNIVSVALTDLTVEQTGDVEFTLAWHGIGYFGAKYAVQISSNGSDWQTIQTGLTDAGYQTAESYVVTNMNSPIAPLLENTRYYFKLSYYLEPSTQLGSSPIVWIGTPVSEDNFLGSIKFDLTSEFAIF